MCCGSGGIRTHGTREGRDLANRCHWPLGDTSFVKAIFNSRIVSYLIQLQ